MEEGWRRMETRGKRAKRERIEKKLEEVAEVKRRECQGAGMIGKTNENKVKNKKNYGHNGSDKKRMTDIQAGDGKDISTGQ